MHMFWLSQALRQLIILQTCTTTEFCCLHHFHYLRQKKNMAFQKDRKLPFYIINK